MVEEEKLTQIENSMEDLKHENALMKQDLVNAHQELEKFKDLEKKMATTCEELEKLYNQQLQHNEQIRQEQNRVDSFVHSSLMNNISAGTEKIKETLGPDDNCEDCADDSDELSTQKDALSPWESMDISTTECSFADAQLLSQKLHLLNSYIDKLIAKNSAVTQELDDISSARKNEAQINTNLSKKIDKLELDLRESNRKVELAQKALDDKHLELSALKTRIDGTSCIEASSLKLSVGELRRKLINEQSKNDHLKEQINHMQIVIEEKNSRIADLKSELKETTNQKDSLESQVNEFNEEKKHLLDEIFHLENKLDELYRFNSHTEQNVSLQDRNVENESLLENNNANDVQNTSMNNDEAQNLIPDLLQLIIKDKNEEIEALTNKLNNMDQKISSVLPSHTGDVNIMLDMLINNYKSLKDELKKNINDTTRIVNKTRSLPSTPRRSIFKEKCVNTDEIPELQRKKIAINQQIIDLPAVPEQDLEDIATKCERMYNRLSNLKEENHILRYELNTLKETKAWDEDNRNEAQVSNESETSEAVENVLQKIHRQSVELLRLTETHRNSRDCIVKQLLETLPLIPVSKFDETSDNLVTNEEMKQLFLKNFPGKEVGTILLDKIVKLYTYYREAKEKITFYLDQNEVISNQLAIVEMALMQAQSKLDIYQRKYEKARRKLKDVAQSENHRLMNKQLLCDQTEVYIRYRRCLSQKSSLVYQKKFLIKVLGDFKLSERKTLALLARINIIGNLLLQFLFI